MNKIKQMLSLVFHGHYDTSTEEGRNKERARNIALTAITAMLWKLLAMATPLITVNITLGYLGEEIYGLWSTVTSFFALFAFADLGFGSGLQTELSRMTATNDLTQCRKLVSSCYAVLVLIAVGLTTVFGCLSPFVNWGGVMNATSAESIQVAGGIVVAIVVSRILNVPMALIQRTQLAMQEGYRSNLWQCSGSLLSLTFVILISKLDLGPLTLVWASSMIQVIVSAVNMVVYFWKQRPELRPSLKYFDKGICKQLLGTGMAFFVLSVFTSLSLSIDNFIVAHTNSLSAVTPYSILLKIATLISVVSHMFSNPMWAANGEALQRGDFLWVKKATRKIVSISFLLSAFAGICAVILIKPALLILTEGTVQVDYWMLIGMCLYQVIVSVTNPYFMILNGAGIVKFQIVNYIVFAAVSLPAKYLLGQQIGAAVIPWVGNISYLLLLTVPTFWRSQRHLKTGK